MCVIWEDCHVLFELTEKLALKVGFSSSRTSDPSFPNLLNQPAPWFCNGKGEDQKVAESSKHMCPGEQLKGLRHKKAYTGEENLGACP